MVITSAIFGGMSGAVGTFISAFRSGLPTGPFIVVFAAVIFLISLFFGKERGILIQKIEYKKQQKENIEKTVQNRQIERRGGNMT